MVDSGRSTKVRRVGDTGDRRIVRDSGMHRSARDVDGNGSAYEAKTTTPTQKSQKRASPTTEQVGMLKTYEESLRMQHGHGRARAGHIHRRTAVTARVRRQHLPVLLIFDVVDWLIAGLLGNVMLSKTSGCASRK